MPKPRRTRRTFTTVVLLVVLSITIITIDQTSRTHRVTSGIKSAASDVFSPIRSGVNDVLNPIGSFFAGAVNYGSVQEENEKLQSTLGQLRLELGEQVGELDQAQQVMALQHLPFLGGIPPVTAQVVEDNVSDFADTIGIDKGRDDGVDVGMPVVAAGGLVGQVVQASHHTATVGLLTDGQSSVGAVLGIRGPVATVDGQGAGKPLSVDFVVAGTPVTPGEKLYTNGLDGGEFPPGVPVASVVAASNPAGTSLERVTARPLANLNQLWYVDVLQWSPTP